MSSAGSGRSAFAIASFCFMPPESAPARAVGERREPGALEERAARARSSSAVRRCGAGAR